MSLNASNAFKNMPAQDKQRLQWAALVLGAVLLSTFNVAPALKTMRDVPPQLAKLDAQTQTLKALQTQAQALQKSPRLSAADATTLLQQSSRELLGTGAQLTLQGARASLTLTGVSADNLAQFLATARTQSHALPIEAHLQKFTGTGANAKELWRGAIILNLPTAGS